MKEIISQGNYTAKDGTVKSYDFSYNQYDTLQDAIADGGEAQALKDLQRMRKVDANNTAREKAKIANGDSTRQPMTEEQKAAAKAERQANKALLERIRAKAEAEGMTPEEYLANL